MYSRIITPPKDKSFFLFGPRGTGKSSWVSTKFSNSIYIDLLESELYQKFLASPQRLSEHIPSGTKQCIVIDEVQKIPALLDEVHRLIESRGLKFVLTGSSARKLKKKGVNLLAGRALTKFLYPLTAEELGQDFKLTQALKYGTLPSIFSEADPKAYLSSYVTTFLKEEVQQEGLTRNLGAFSRFLEAASFSQACQLNISEVARESSVERKVVESYFEILEDLLLAIRIPVFSKRAKRKMAAHPKFFFFDTGVYRTLRPAGPLDKPEEIDGAALETLLFQELRALNEYYSLDYTLHYWRTSDKLEIDFVLYGPRGIVAIEIKRSRKIAQSDLKGLKAFLADYPMAKAYLLYGGEKELRIDGISLVPSASCFPKLKDLIS